MTASTPTRSLQRFLLVVCVLLAALVIAVVGQHLLARPSLSSFNPAELGRLESAMWRSYYERHWIRLGVLGMQTACGQSGFSWWDAARIAKHTAFSAAYFSKRTDDPRCIPELEKYYRIIQSAAPVRFDVSEAARLELEWWTARRKQLPPGDWAHTIAKLTALVYGISETDALPASRLRVEAMDYRDERGDKMTGADWDELTRQLQATYAAFHAELNPPQKTAP